MYRLFRLTNDYAFKRVFEDEEVAAAFLSDLLNLPIELFDEIKIVNPILLGETIDLKVSILDISLKLKTGEVINIEMQVARDRVIVQRLLCQAGKLMANQIPKGKSEPTYNKLKKTIIVAILVENHFNENTAYHKTYKLYDKKNESTMTDLLEFHILELNRVENLPVEEPVYEWCKAFNLSHEQDEEGLKELSKKSQKVAKAVQKLESISRSERERQLYDSRERALMQTRDNLVLAQEETKIESIKNLLDLLDDEILAERFGFSVEEVKNIRNAQENN